MFLMCCYCLANVLLTLLPNDQGPCQCSRIYMRETCEHFAVGAGVDQLLGVDTRKRVAHGVAHVVHAGLREDLGFS